MAYLLAHPLAKVPVIIANTYATHLTASPPRPVTEANKREPKEATNALPLLTRITVPLFTSTNIVLGVCDVYIVLSTVYPLLHVPLLNYILLPSPATVPKVSDLYLTSSFVFGSLLLYAGTYFRYLSYRALGRHFTFQLSLQTGHKLITGGPYAIVRHPSYLGLIIAFHGLVIAQFFSQGTWWVESGMWQTLGGQVFGVYWIGFLVFVCVSLLWRVPEEDTMLRTQFQEQWTSWARKTYAVIPYVW